MKKYTSCLILFIMIFHALDGYTQRQVVPVTDQNLGKWIIDPQSKGKITFMENLVGPPQHPDIPRGLQFLPTDDGNLRIRLSGYQETYLKDINELKYSTLTEINTKLVPFLVLQVSYYETENSSNKRAGFVKLIKAKLVYIPSFQDLPDQVTIVPNTWQQWDCLQGRWVLNTDDKVDLDAPPNDLVYTIEEFYTKHPSAKIIYDDEFKGDAIRLSAGGTTDWANIKSYADNFIIGISNWCGILFSFAKAR